MKTTESRRVSDADTSENCAISSPSPSLGGKNRLGREWLLVRVAISTRSLGSSLRIKTHKHPLERRIVIHKQGQSNGEREQRRLVQSHLELELNVG